MRAAHVSPKLHGHGKPRGRILRARKPAAHPRQMSEQLMAQMREANEHLVVASVRAQRVAEDAEEANHIKDYFLATVSHELRTPLNAVLGWTRMLESKQLPPGGAEHALAAIGRSAAALAQMIDDLLDTARILNGTIRMAQQRVDLVGVVQAALDAVRPLAEAGKVQLAFDARSSHRMVTGDAARLQQVIWNLLENAIKFTPKGGRVDVLIQSSNDHIEVSVADTGQGISQDFLPHVFERFRQAEGATTARHTGLGLGLGIVVQLVGLHGGTVQAASPGLGQGATFTVRLPIPAGEAPARAVARSTPSPQDRS